MVAQVRQEDKVRVVEELTRDDHVAAKVTTGLLRRPDVAFRAMSDDTARHQVNHAQVERGRRARERFEDTSPVAPAVRSIDRSVEFLDLVTACHAFVAAAGRVVPGMRDRRLGGDERTIVHENVARVRATLDWIETAVDTGKVDIDGELARLLQGEWPMPRASARGSPAAQRHADTVRFVLFEARPAGSAFAQLVGSSELSPHGPGRAWSACDTPTGGRRTDPRPAPQAHPAARWAGRPGRSPASSTPSRSRLPTPSQGLPRLRRR